MGGFCLHRGPSSSRQISDGMSFCTHHPSGGVRLGMQPASGSPRGKENASRTPFRCNFFTLAHMACFLSSTHPATGKEKKKRTSPLIRQSFGQYTVCGHFGDFFFALLEAKKFTGVALMLGVAFPLKNSTTRAFGGIPLFRDLALFAPGKLPMSKDKFDSN